MFPLGSDILMHNASTFMPELIRLFACKDIKLQLLYRGTRDGFTNQQFHEKCDAAARTLVVAKSENGYISGGYASQSWSGNGCQPYNGQFIFSLYPTPLKLKCSADHYQKAQYCHPSAAAVFGKGHDLHIFEQRILCIPKSYITVAPGYPNPSSDINNETLFGTKNSTAVG
jgi:hypothetical protein